MKIQSLSIHVPTGKGCINNCEFCVSRMHESPYEDRIGPAVKDDQHSQHETFDAFDDYENRLYHAKENGVNTVILTGTGEPIQNVKFLEWFGGFNKNKTKFRWIEIQTSGNMLLGNVKTTGIGQFRPDKEISTLRFLRIIGVSTISLSVSDIFDSDNNAKMNNIPKGHWFSLLALCKEIKNQHLNLRLSLNMTDVYNNKTPQEIFDRLKELGVDQVTFRKLYKSPGNSTPQDKWIDEHGADDNVFSYLDAYIVGEPGVFNENGEIKGHGKFQGVLPYGASKYSVDGISTVVDDNCMDDATKRESADSYKYLILRPNCKLYSNWDDKGSLIF